MFFSTKTIITSKGRNIK